MGWRKECQAGTSADSMIEHHAQQQGGEQIPAEQTAFHPIRVTSTPSGIILRPTVEHGKYPLASPRKVPAMPASSPNAPPSNGQQQILPHHLPKQCLRAQHRRTCAHPSLPDDFPCGSLSCRSELSAGTSSKTSNTKQEVAHRGPYIELHRWHKVLETRGADGKRAAPRNSTFHSSGCIRFSLRADFLSVSARKSIALLAVLHLKSNAESSQIVHVVFGLPIAGNNTIRQIDLRIGIPHQITSGTNHAAHAVVGIVQPERTSHHPFGGAEQATRKFIGNDSRAEAACQVGGSERTPLQKVEICNILGRSLGRSSLTFTGKSPLRSADCI